MDSSLNILYIVGSVVVALLGLVVIKVALKLDVNKWLERRDQKAAVRLQNTCPHMSVEYDIESGQFKVESFFVSPSMTTNWICGQCNMVIPSQLMIPKYPNDLNGAKEVIQAQKKFDKLAKKAGFL